MIIKIRKVIISIIIISLLLSTTSLCACKEDTESINSYKNVSEEKNLNIPIPTWDKLFGPFLFLSLEADLSTKEFVYFENQEDTGQFYIYIEFLRGDANDDSYIKWSPGLFIRFPEEWHHKDPGYYDYVWVHFKRGWKKNIQYSNGRIHLKLSGFIGRVFLTHTVHPVHDFSKPRDPAIIGPIKGKRGVDYEYTFFSRDYGNADLKYYIDWGDGNIENWIGPYNSLEAFTLTHSWDSKGTYDVSAKVRNITSPMSQQSYKTTLQLRISRGLFFGLLDITLL